MSCFGIVMNRRNDGNLSLLKEEDGWLKKEMIESFKWCGTMGETKEEVEVVKEEAREFLFLGPMGGLLKVGAQELNEGIGVSWGVSFLQTIWKLENNEM